MEEDGQQHSDEDDDYEYDDDAKKEEAVELPGLEFEYELRVEEMPIYLKSLVSPLKDDMTCDRVYVVLRFKDGVATYSIKKSDSKRLGALISIFEQAVKSVEVKLAVRRALLLFSSAPPPAMSPKRKAGSPPSPSADASPSPSPLLSPPHQSPPHQSPPLKASTEKGRTGVESSSSSSGVVGSSIDPDILLNELRRNQLFDVVVQKLYSYLLFCPVCSEQHSVTPESLVPCEKVCCLEKFITQKLGPDIKNAIVSTPEYVDLIVSITYWALEDERFPERRDENFSPFPQQLVNKGKRSYDQVKRDLDELPSVDIMCDMIDNGSFDSYFEEHLELKEIFYILEWILFSNRTALRYIPPADLSPQEKTYADQAPCGKLFRIVNRPDVEAAFQHNKGAKATEWVFHGSDSTCWHGILRHGLQVMSNTKYMTHGAAHGAGIYLATDIKQSMAYCKPAVVRWPQQKHHITSCMMIGEFIPHNTDDKGTAYSTVPYPGYRVAREKKYFIPRYLLCSLAVT